MQRYRLKITENDFEQLKQLLFADHPREAGAFLLAGSAHNGNMSDILVRRVIAIPKEHFVVQHNYRLEVSSQAINGLIALCEANRLGAVVCHSHPDTIPYSPSDDHGERRIFEVLRRFIPENGPTASLLLYPKGLDARVWLPNTMRPVPVDEVVIIGRNIQKVSIQNHTHNSGQSDKLYSRQVLAFGLGGQRAIEHSKVGVVGVGGTGSACAEQLVRLGVRNVVLIDHDLLETSNISRVYGSFRTDFHSRFSWLRRKHKSKVEVVSKHLRRINPRVRIQTLKAHIAEARATALLLDRDVIFLCTDDHWGRSIVNQISHQYLIPTINVGVRIDAQDGKVVGAVGVIDILRADMPCLWCKQFLRSERIAAESMPREARQNLEREGYVEGIDSPAPSVVSLTTTVASFAVTLFLQLLTDFMAERGNVSRLNYDILSGTVTRGSVKPAENCICRNTKGFGDAKTLPTVESVVHQ